MNRDEITEILLDTIEVLAEGKIEDTGLDQTVEAVVIRCLSYATGEYVVKYSGGTFSAYSKDLDKIYQPDSIVKVLIPKGDASQTKIILGQIDSPNIEKTEEKDKHPDIKEEEFIGTNICTPTSEINGWYLSTWDPAAQNKILYQYNASQNDLYIEPAVEQIYLNSAQYISISASFKTEIDYLSQKEGDFGIECVATFKNPLTNDYVDRTYILNVDCMVGNAYAQVDATPQEIHYLIDGANFDHIKTIKLFCKDFPVRESLENLKPDIYISNIEIKGMVKTEIDDNGYTLKVLTHQDPYKDKLTFVDLQAEVYKNLKYQDINANTMECYWFKENHSIKCDSDGYVSYGGDGWECINSYEEIENRVSENEAENKIKVYKTGIPFVSIPYLILGAKETRIKCVIVFLGTDIILTKQVVLKNLVNQYKLKLTSSSGLITAANQTVVTAEVEPSDGHNFTYSWSYYVDDGRKGAAPTTTGNNIIVDLTEAVNKVDCYCTVTDADFGNEIAIGSITIRRGAEDSADPFTLIINGGNQVFKYDANGDSPAIQSSTSPQEIQPLSITLLDPYGNEIDNEDLQIDWYVPGSGANSLLKNIQILEDKTITFEIADKYDYTALDNIIKVEVHYDNTLIKGQTNFFFLKDGENGSNGTSYQIKIVPNTNDVIEGLPYYYKKRSNDAGFNFRPNGNSIKIIFYKDGQAVYDTVNGIIDNLIEISPTYNFQNLIRRYTANIYDTSHFKISSNILEWNNSHGYSIDTTLGQQEADIIKGTLNYNNLSWHYYFPIPYILYNQTQNMDGYKITIEKNKGFTEVMYAEDGQNPIYKGTSQFSFIVKDDANNIITPDITYQILGQKYDDAWKNSNDLVLNNNEIQPAALYDGNSVTNAILATLSIDGTEIATIHIPIVMYLNTYGHKYTNEWDGVSIELNDKGGVALMPQLVAGSKDEFNRFTGIVGGKVKDNSTEQENNLNNIGFKHGLFGYNNGQQTFALSAKDGSASFGISGAGQIKIIPDDDAIIEGGEYKLPEGQKPGTGMRINLTEPSIQWGNGNFKVDSNGNLIAKNADLSGKIVADKGEIGGWIIGKPQENQDTALYKIYEQNGEKLYQIGMRASSTRTNQCFYIWDYVAKKTVFGVTGEGNLTATKGKIGNWSISGNNIRYPATGTATTILDGSNGKLTTTKANIGGWEVTSGKISAGKTELNSNGKISFANGSAFFSMGDGTKHPVASSLNLGPATNDLDPCLTLLKTNGSPGVVIGMEYIGNAPYGFLQHTSGTSQFGFKNSSGKYIARNDNLERITLLDILKATNYCLQHNYITPVGEINN